MKNKVEIKKMVFNLGDKEIEITPEQAKKLYDVLGTIYGKKEVTIVEKKEYIPYYAPIYIEQNKPWWDYNKIIYSGSSENINCSIDGNSVSFNLKNED